MEALIFIFIVYWFWYLTKDKVDYSDQSPTFEEVDKKRKL